MPFKLLNFVAKTLKGELVRSRSEKRIADFLFQHNIRYEYEPTLQLGDTRVKPDFYLPEREVYVEFWGLVAKPDYYERMRWKLKLYQQFQVKMLSLFHNDLCQMEKCLSTKLLH